MKNKSSILLFALLVTTSIHAGEIQDEFFKRKDISDYKLLGEYKIVEIGMERTSCYGFCPSYTVRLKEDGSIIYNGGKYAKIQGAKQGKINEMNFSKIAEFMKESDFIYMRDEYSSMITDSPTVYTYIKFDGNHKSVKLRGEFKFVRNYAQSGPVNLWAIEQLIDQQINSAEWQVER